MKIKKSITSAFIFLLVILVAGLTISNVMAQENGNGSLENGQNGVKGNGNNQQGVMQQQNNFQNNELNGCSGACEDCTETNTGKNAIPQQKNLNIKNQDNQSKTGCTGDCDSCTLGNPDEGQAQKKVQLQNCEMIQTQEEFNKLGNENLSVADCEFSYEISGQELKSMTIAQIAEKWEIKPESLLAEIIDAFGLSGSYKTDSLLDDLRQEYRFRPAQIKVIAESVKSDL